MRAFAYLRVSGKNQVEGDGFPRQLAAINGYALATGTEIAHVFQEEGVTGTQETMDRPAWIAMMVALHSDGVKTVIVENLSRLARDLMVQEAAIADFHKSGFTLVSVAEPDLMATDPSRIMIRQILGAVSQYEKSMIVARLRGARMRTKLSTGRCEGRKPFGHMPGEEITLARMIELRAANMSYEKIAAVLNAEALKPRKAAKFHASVVQDILKAQVAN